MWQCMLCKPLTTPIIHRHCALKNGKPNCPCSRHDGGRIDLALGAKIRVESLATISATNSSERRKYFTELVNLSHTKKKQLAVCQMSWIMWSLDYQIDALATIDAEAIIFQAQLERKNRWIDMINRWIQLIWSCTSTWLLSTENHLKRTPRWTTAGIILNSRIAEGSSPAEVHMSQ